MPGIEEQETIINFSRDEDVAHIFTSDTTVMTKLDKLVENGASEFERVELEPDGSLYGKWYTCPKRCISFRARPMSEERRKAMSERAIAEGISARL